MSSQPTNLPAKKTGLAGVFFGWWIVITGGMLTFWGNGVSTFVSLHFSNR